MAREKALKMVEKNVVLSIDNEVFQIQGFEGEELKGDTDSVTYILGQFVTKGEPIDITIKTHKAKKESEKKPKLVYKCDCNEFESKNKNLNIICGDCNERFELIEEVQE